MAYDVAVIGGGPGGYVAGIRCAQHGLKTAVIERDELGGTCLNRGCIPTKTYLASAELYLKMKNALDYGIRVQNAGLDLSLMKLRKDRIVKQLGNSIGYLLKKNRVDLIRGEGRLVSSRVINIAAAGKESIRLEAGHVIIATGSAPSGLAGIACGKGLVTSEEILGWDEAPESLLVIGGGVIGCELSMIFSILGTRVIIVEAMTSVLPALDREISAGMEDVLIDRGIKVITGATVKSMKTEGSGIRAVLSSGEEIEARKALLSVGRVPCTKGLGLAEAGIATGPRGEVIVNSRMQTSVTGVYAIGDATGLYQLAHVAQYQGMCAAANIAGRTSFMDYSVVPSCVYTKPEIGCVGINSQEAKQKGLAVKVGRFPFSASGKAVCLGETAGFVKIISDSSTDRVLGIHMMGSHATELVAEAAIALETGITSEELAGIIHAHPTLSEAVAEAAHAVRGKCIHI